MKKEIDKLKKPNALIHISNPLSIVNRKVYNFILCYVYYTDNYKKDEYWIDISLIDKYTETRNIEYLRKQTKKLQTTILEIDIFNDEGILIGYKDLPLLSDVLYNENTNQLYVSFGKKMLELLRSKDMKYQIFYLSMLKSLKSKYSMALYENCKRYENVSTTGNIEVNELRKVLGALKPTYQENRRFIQLLLKPAIKEINDKTDIEITYETKKRNREIKYIKFNITKQNKKIEKTPIFIEINPEKKIEENKVITNRAEEILHKLKLKHL